MSEYKTAEVNGIDLERRSRRALTECMTVLPDGGDIYTVIGENGGGEYRVDARDGRCTCPDYQYRDVTCKHIRRVAFATGQFPIPADIPVDDLLAEHVDCQPRMAVADGGVDAVESDGDADTDSDSDDGDRPADCDCGGVLTDLPCWPCYRDGFRSPAGGG